MYVHVPLFVPKRFLDGSRNGAYGGAVAAIDWAMATLDAELDRLGIKENTLVVFTSDNGSRASGEGGSNGPLRGTKAQTWEGGQRVPCMMRWPEKSPPVQRVLALPLPSISLQHLLKLLMRHQRLMFNVIAAWLTPTLFDHAPSPRDSFGYYRREHLEAIRVGDWKLHYCKIGWAPAVKGEEHEVFDALYNLREDPGETTNVFDQHPSRC